MTVYRSLSLRILQTGVALMAGLGIGLALQALLQRQAHPAAFPAPVFGEMRSTADPAVSATLDSSIMVDGDVPSSTFGRLALSDGTRFALGLTSNCSGAVEVRAFSPRDPQRSQLLWTGVLNAGVPAQTPRLVLTGRRGLETLQVILRTVGGDEIARRTVEILHV